MKDKPVDRDVDRMHDLLARKASAEQGAQRRASAAPNRARRDRRRRGVIGGVAVALFAAAVIVTPHFLKTSPTTNESTDPTNGVDAAQSAPARPRCGPVDQQKLSTSDVDHLAPAVAGIVCYTVDPMGTRAYANDDGLLSETQIAALEADIEVNDEASGGGCIDTGPVRVIRLVDEGGDVTAWVDDRCTGEFRFGDRAWTPSAEAEQIITEALGGSV